MKRFFQKAVFIPVACLMTSFAMPVSAETVVEDSRTPSYQADRPVLDDINAFIERRGGLDRVQEDAKGGDADANYWLGIMHREGIVFEKNSDKAADYLMDSAAKLHPKGLYELSRMMDRSDSPESTKYLQLAAFQENPKAQYDLAVRYLAGEGVQKSNTMGFFWLSKSASSGFPKAVAKERSLIEKNQDLDQSFDAVYERAITGNVDALVSLAVFYREGIKVEKDEAFANELLSTAANLKSERAIKILSE